MAKTLGILVARPLVEGARTAPSRYYSTCLDAFLMSRIDLTERRASHFTVGTMRLSRADLYRRMLGSRGSIPEEFCGPLGVSVGSTYGDAARMLLMQMGEIRTPTFLQLIG